MSQFRLLETRRFYPLFWTQFLGAFNDNFLKNALVILITFQTGKVAGIPSDQMVAVAGGIFILPFFLFSATSGQLADKFDKIQIIRWVKLAEIGIMLLASAGFVLHRYELLLFVLFLMGLHSTIFGPVKYSILPQHLEESELVGGNALIEAATFLAILLGTIGGGVLISVSKIGPALVSVGLVAVAVAGYWVSRLVPSAPPLAPALKIDWNPWRPTAEVLRSIRGNRAIFLSILGISWFWLLGAAILSLLPPYCKDVLHTDQSGVTLFLALFSIGVGVGSLLCERLSRDQLELGLVPLGSIGLSLFVLDLFFVGTPEIVQPGEKASALQILANPSGLRIVLDLLLLSVFSGFFIVPLYTLVQERAEASQRSRVIAANNILNAFFMVVGSVLLVLFMKIGLTIPQIFLALALMNGVIAVYIYSLLPEFLLRFLVWGIANVMYRMQVRGLENVPKKGAAVLVCNHVSFIDWMIISAAVKRPARFVMDHSFAKGGLRGWLFAQAKVIPIASSKEEPKLMEAAFEKIAIELKDGAIVCIFPEGKITWDGKLNAFKPGIERIIRETPVPVVPMALNGLWGSFFSREGGRAILKWPRRFWSRVSLEIAPALAPETVSAAALHEKVGGLLDVR